MSGIVSWRHVWRQKRGKYDLAPPIWRRRFGAGDLAPADLAPTRFGARTIWRRAPIETIWRRAPIETIWRRAPIGTIWRRAPIETILSVLQYFVIRFWLG